MKYDIIIIGAGAAGLMAAYELLQAGYRVGVLEAAAVAGGRMATLIEPGFSVPVETGAEFVHGELPLTLELLNKAGIKYIPVEGSMQSIRCGKWNSQEAHDEHWSECMAQLERLQADMSIDAFLQQFFAAEKYVRLRDAVRRYAAGFDLADPNDASALAASVEWNQEEETQYRIPGGYRQLVDYFLACIHEKNDGIHFNTCINKIKYDQKSVTAFTSDGRSFEASKILVTVSAGILQSGKLTFDPLPDSRYNDAIQQLGFGDVIKILLEFKTCFWVKQAKDVGFIISDEKIPTWWTQLPRETNLLTGWLGGPPATAKSGDDDAAIVKLSLEALSNIFRISTTDLQQQLVHAKINRWRSHPHVLGGYSYIKLGSADAKKILLHPLEGTVFFAGEALYRGQSQGTVEAALQSGWETAKRITASF